MDDGYAVADVAPIDADFVGVLDGIDLPIIVVGGDCTLQQFNRAASTTFGLTPANIGQLPRTIVSLVGIQEFEKLCSRVVTDEVSSRRDIQIGEQCFLLRLAPYRRSDGRVAGAVLTFTDVTAFRASIQRAVYEREYTKTILNTVTEPLVVLDAELRVQTANQAFYTLFGVLRESIQGAPLRSMGDEDWQSSSLWETLRDAVMCHGEPPPVELDHDFGGVERRRMVLSACRLPRAGGPTLLLAFKDVTSQHRAVEALREADRRKDEFLATFAHELRNPLAPVRTAMGIIQQRGSEDEVLTRNHAIIDRQVQTMARLLDDLLDVSRITRGMVRIAPEHLDLAQLVRATVDACRPSLEERSHRLALRLPSEAVPVDVDPVRVEQVLVNLLTNASKYTRPGGDVEVVLLREGGEAVLQVRDNGTGIEPRLLPHIFDLFTQGERALDRSEGGLGIGLTMVKRLVELHGGEVEAHSAGIGCGSVFTVRLPLAQDAVSTHSKKPPAGAPVPIGARSRRVLVVDDNQDAASTLEEIIALWGHDVRAVFDGTAALHLFQTYQPDVVVLDLGMPGMDGYQVARELRQDAERMGVSLIALSGYGQEADRALSREAGFIAHLTKPVDVDELQQLLIASGREPNLSLLE
jgi:two-component system CheB/CheR fusion protein